MKLKTEIINEIKHNGGATCIGWINSEEILSCGDDQTLLKINVLNRDITTLTKLPTDAYPLDMHWPVRSPGSSSAGTVGTHSSSGGITNKSADIILITAADGKFHLINRTGRLERSVEAHQGACLVGRWSYDGAGFMTAGEDGLLKIWSRSGMLRTTLTSCDTPIYAGAWAPDNQAICHSNGRILCIRFLATNLKTIRWKAHDGLVLKISWCPTNNLIVSGGEDCRYRVWNSLGHPLYVSGYHEYPITSVAWSPSGEMFSIGCYNTIRVCDASGWSEALEKPQVGSPYQIDWSTDGTQLAASCANGHIFYAHIIERRFNWKTYSIVLTDVRTLSVEDLNDETIEQLDFPDRVVHVNIGFDHLIVTTPNQCHIYNTSNWNTPIIFDLKEGAVCLLLSSEKYIAIIERSNISVYNYQGRLIASPRWSGMHAEALSKDLVTLSSDVLVTRDNLDFRAIHIFELSGTAGVRSNIDSGTQIQHSVPIAEISLNQSSIGTDRHLAVIDINRDLYLVPVREFGQKPFLKIASQILSMQWSPDYDILAVIQDGRLVVWYAPIASAYNARMLRLASMEQDADLGKNPRLYSFQDTTLFIRRSDGSLITVLVSPYIFTLHKQVMANHWEKCLKLCRTIQHQVLWATLAALAIHAKMIDVAEEAFAAIPNYDKVSYVQHMKQMPNKALQMAGAALLKGATAEAESILLHNGLLFHAIYSNINLYAWDRALDLALKHKTHIDTVLYLRKEYLNSLSKEETNAKFLQLNNSVEIDETIVKRKIKIELDKSNY